MSKKDSILSRGQEKHIWHASFYQQKSLYFSKLTKQGNVRFNF